jgi:hypothetical protein
MVLKYTSEKDVSVPIQIVDEKRQLSDPTTTYKHHHKYGIRADFKDGRMSKMDFYIGCLKR